MPRLAAAVLLLIPLVALAAPPKDQWFTVLLDGRKIGSFESKRAVEDGRVMTTQDLELAIERAGVRVSLSSIESTTETTSGKPLAFQSVSRLSGSETIVAGRIHDGVVDVTTTSAGATTKRTLDWPDGALLAEGLRLAGIKAGLAPGTSYRSLAFQPSSLDTAEIETRIGEVRSVDLPDGRKPLHEIEQTMRFSGAAVKSRVWVDAEQTIYKLTMPVIGVDLDLLACDRACANAPNQGTDIFDRTLMESPRALTRAELDRGMRYTLEASPGGAPIALPETGEQRVARKGERVEVEITPDARAGDEDPPAAVDYAPNDWLQSKAPEVESLAQRAAGDVDGARAKMKALETFVRGFIRDKNLGVGYASALEVAKNPEGDCTEHAVLLAALGRSLGIATRVVDGLAYAPGFAGKDRVFVPHAWVQAWIDGRWQSFDAALAGFDAGHIALSIGDGDPWRFYSGLDTLGRIEMRSAQPLATEIVR